MLLLLLLSTWAGLSSQTRDLVSRSQDSRREGESGQVRLVPTPTQLGWAISAFAATAFILCSYNSDVSSKRSLTHNRLSQSNVNSVVRSYLSPTPVGWNRVCTFRLQNKAFSQGCKLPDLPNRPVKYLENGKIIHVRTDFVVVPRTPPSFRRL